MKKKLLFFIGIVLLCIIAAGFYLYNKPRTGVDNSKADITIMAGDLYKQYNDNESAADKKFLSKIIAVTGTAGEVSKTDSSYIILLKNNTDLGGVSCSLFTIDTKAIQRGKTVTIKGRCTGFLMDVALTDCVIEKP